MSVFRVNNQDSRRAEPTVWLSRIVLLKSIDPLEEIRSVELHTGVNVVWGVEGTDSGEPFQPGHGVGKTTFCRLIRYCLGETSFGQRHAVAEIRNTFPDGYVAAELRLAGETWSVLRPFGQHRASYAKAGTTVSELIGNKPPRQSYSEFSERLARTCLAGIRNEGVLTGGGSIRWEHLLAMCTRDQEARYQDYWNWRSGRSDSDPLGFRQPRVDALLCLRLVLDLLPNEETELQTRLRGITDDLAQVNAGIADRRREPEYWVRHLRGELAKLGCENAEQASFEEQDLFGLPQLVHRRIATLESTASDACASLAALDRQIALAAAALREPRELQAQEQTVAKTTDRGTELLTGMVRELEELRDYIRAAEFSLCRYGGVSIGGCDYAKQQLLDLEQQIRDERRTGPAEGAARDQATAAMRERIARRAQIIRDLQAKLAELQRERDQPLDARRGALESIKSIRAAWEALQRWSRILAGTEPDTELNSLISRRAALAAQQTQRSDELTALLRNQDSNVVRVRQALDDLVKATLSCEYLAKVELSESGLEFRVFRGASMSGEAFETLAILLTDLAVLFLGATNEAAHPGLLIHDSPREADLGSAIYRKMLESAATVAEELRGGNDKFPFQYIVTSTTPPPKRLQSEGLIRLPLGGEHGLLFGCQLKAEPRDTQMTFSAGETAGE